MPNSPQTSFDVFISYSTHDVDWVETLARNLKGVGHRVFFDKWSIPPGRNFPDVLEPESCRKLAVEPMGNMNLRFESEALVSRLIETTGGRANLIAAACNEILKNLDKETRIIGAAEMDAALESDAIRESLLGWGSLLGREREDETRLDRIIVYATVEKPSFTEQALFELLSELKVAAKTLEVERSLRRLELAFVLGRKKGVYTYQVPLFKQMLLEEACKEKLEREIKTAES